MTIKKGMSMFLVNTIFVLVALVILAPMIAYTIERSGKIYDLRKCHDALLVEDVAFNKINQAIPAAKTQKPWPASCRPIGPDSIEGKTNSDIMRNIANRMVQCYWSLGQNSKEFDPFKETWVSPGDDCFSCYSIIIKSMENEKITKDDFNQWLTINHLDNDESKPTFWNYLRGGEGRTPEENMILTDLMPNVYYAIVYQDSTSSTLFENIKMDSIFVVDWNVGQTKCGGFKEDVKNDKTTQK